jgi:hypothetical protein
MDLSVVLRYWWTRRNVSLWRKGNGMNTEELAAMVGVSDQQLRNWIDAGVLYMPIGARMGSGTKWDWSPRECQAVAIVASAHRAGWRGREGLGVIAECAYTGIPYSSEAMTVLVNPTPAQVSHLARTTVAINWRPYP